MIEEKKNAREVIQLQDDFYILATSSLADDRTAVLKQDETLGLFDRHGDVFPLRFGDQGLYHDGTRFLSRMELRLADLRPLLLSSRVVDENRSLAVDLTNPDISRLGRIIIPRGTLHIFRSKFLLRGQCHERLRVSNYGMVAVEVDVSLRFGADFADIFEVRGMKRANRGTARESFDKGVFSIEYDGLDKIKRTVRIEASPRPARTDDSEMIFPLRLAPKEENVISLAIVCTEDGAAQASLPYEEAWVAADKAREDVRQGVCRLRTSNERFNGWINRSNADLLTMTTRTDHGLYPFAGVPWFSAPFGRDGVITALECLWTNPSLARGVLTYLADRQATEENAERDCEPGKILHESRAGEMANLKEIPFGLYYGSVDSTPLFVILAGAYYRRTGDRAFIKTLWPAIDAALGWMDQYGDKDGDGFLEYQRRTPTGLANQGWKDSNDSVFHDDGQLAEGPIALCEVQSYMYRAKNAAASLATALGKVERAAILTQQAERLKGRFEQAFWSEELSTYALALDGEKRPCRVRTSNAGHALFGGIASATHAGQVIRALFADDAYSGWGIRTVSSKEKLYNPMSYHNGSIWPHDNAMVAQGMSRYGYTAEAARVMNGLFDATTFFETQRLPELFCGFRRRGHEGPTLYPVACSPQAWASGAVFMALQASLGLQIDGIEGRVSLHRPVLPAYLDWVEIKDLHVGATTLDLLLERHDVGVGVRILRRDGPADVIVTV